MKNRDTMKSRIINTFLRLACCFFLASEIMTSFTNAQALSLKQLEDASDLILIGKSRATLVDGSVATIEINPTRVLKGSLSASPQTLIVADVRVGPQYVEVLTKLLKTPSSQKNQNAIGMWFLKRVEGENWEANPISGTDSIPQYFVLISDESLTGDFAYDSSVTVQARIIKELEAEMERVMGSSQMVFVRHKSLQFIAHNLIDSGMDGVAEVASRFSKSRSDILRTFALSWRIRGGDHKVLTDLENEKALLGSESSSSQIANSISLYRGNSPIFIQGLGRLTSKSFPSRIREEAGRVLRAVHSKEAVPFLVEMLDSDLDRLRYNGVMGIASFALNLPITTPENTRNMNWLKPEARNSSVPYVGSMEETAQYMPAIDMFEKDQTRYTSYWKGWWNKNRGLIEQQ